MIKPKIYQKLVRDKIPEIMTREGLKPTVKTLTEAEYQEALIKKLDEEVAEFKQTRSPEELADILEVLYSLASIQGVTESTLHEMKEAKRDKKGSFEKRVLLYSVVSNI
jgi:predicted house-cleaning noncanonical NTP pyrophosphatase (MazG superfamily)